MTVGSLYEDWLPFCYYGAHLLALDVVVWRNGNSLRGNG